MAMEVKLLDIEAILNTDCGLAGIFPGNWLNPIPFE
jgi:hypothetical protein